MEKLVIFFLALTSAKGLIYNCNYSNKSWTEAGNLYGCIVSSIAVGTTLDVENVLGSLGPGKVLEDVETFSVTRKPVKKMAFGLEDFLPNLKVIQLYSAQLESISMEDLRPFPMLEFLNLASNFLTTLPGDLFKFNPNLKFFQVYSNKLTTVGQGILDDLIFLASVDFTLNPCINKNGKTTEEIEILREELLQKCLPAGETIAPRTVKSTLATTTKPLTTISTITQTTLTPTTTTLASTTKTSTLKPPTTVSVTTVEITLEPCSLRCTLNNETDELKSKVADIFEKSEKLKQELSKLKIENFQLKIVSAEQEREIGVLSGST